MITYILVILGAINYGLVGFFDWNLIEAILGMGGATRAVYALVGVSAIVELVGHRKGCKACSMGCGTESHSSESAPEQDM